MKIRNRLTLLISVVTAAILLCFALIVYWLAAENRQRTFYRQLRQEAMTRASIFFEPEVDSRTLENSFLQIREMYSGVAVAIYDPGYNLLYHDGEVPDFFHQIPGLIGEAMPVGEMLFSRDGLEVAGILFGHNGKDHVVVAAAYDDYGHRMLLNLRKSLFFAWLAAVFLSFVAGRLFSEKAMNPVSQMADKAGEISVTNLHLRLAGEKGKDEIALLAATFNQMLDRLENSFDAQRQFVSNIAHELRTPLSAISGEIELALSQKNLSGECRNIFGKVLADTRRISRLSTSLMDMAKASYETHQISLKEVRIDEVIMDARNDVINSHPDYTVNIHIDEQLDDERLVTIRGNDYLLKVAFANLFDNGCKFSEDGVVSIHIRYKPVSGVLEVAVKDNGIGIPDEDLEHVFSPFYRGKNAGAATGSGIGLSLVQRVMHIHGAEIIINSETNKVTEVRVLWKRGEA